MHERNRNTRDPKELYDHAFEKARNLENYLSKFVEDSKLAETNPAMYISLLSREASYRDIAPLFPHVDTASIEPENLDKEVEHYTSSLGILLRKYTGKRTLSIAGHRVTPGSYFWDTHVDFDDEFFSSSVFTRMERVIRDFQLLFLYTDEVPSDSTHLPDLSFRIDEDQLFIGKVSHIGKLLRRFSSDTTWPVDGVISEQLVNIYVQLMQLKTESQRGERTVRSEDLYSSVLTREIVSSRFPRHRT